MQVNARLASNAYQALSRLTGLPGLDAPAQPAETGEFARLLRGAVDQVQSQARTHESRAQGFVQGRTELVDVVAAVSETEVALETLVAVRDRVIAAYEEIMRMPI